MASSVTSSAQLKLASKIINAQKPRMPVLTSTLADRINLHVGYNIRSSTKLLDLKQKKNKRWNKAMATIHPRERRAIVRALSGMTDYVPKATVGDIRNNLRSDTRSFNISRAFLVLVFTTKIYGSKPKKKKQKQK